MSSRDLANCSTDFHLVDIYIEVHIHFHLVDIINYVMSHVGWREEQTTIYKGVKTSPSIRVLRP